MMRKNNNRGGGNKHRSGGGNNSGGGVRRYNNSGSGNGNGGNRGGANDSQNIQRQKHHATQQLGKYGDMARNAQINGDRVDVEYYLQHVDHYTRVLADIEAIEAERYSHQRESQIIPGGPNDPNAAQYQPEASAQPAEANAEPATDVNAPNAEAPAVAQAPRMARQPRRQHPSTAPEADDNGAKAANSNTTDIPLPDSILPPI